MPEHYTVAVISDVHGNAAAFDAVCDELSTQNYDQLVVAGDHVLLGPRPEESLEKLQALDTPMLLGNTDQYFFQPDPRPIIQELVEIVTERIGPDGVAFLSSLPIAHRVTPLGGVSPDDDLLIIHATPTDVDATLILEPDPEGGLTVTPEDEAEALLGGEKANLILYGHVHYAATGTVHGQRLASINGVGFSIDGDPRAGYALARWDGQTWELDRRRVEYDIAQAVREMPRLFGQREITTTIQDRLREGRFVRPFA